MLCVFCISNAANYLTFAAEEDGSTFGIVNKNNNPDVQYSLDGGETWTALVKGDAITLVHKGDKALLRGNNPEGFSKGYNKYSSFTMTGKIAASGSVMSLIDGTGETLVVPADYCFYSLFSGCTSLTQAPELPATTLADGCYTYMFEGCTSLTQAPEFPATTLVKSCYLGMFWGCTSLTQAPELPATTLAEACYSDMFRNCTSLTQAPALPATTLPTVSNVKGGCYISMFSGCTSLSRIRVSFDDWNDGLHTLEWVKDVAPAGTFICPKDLPLEYGVRRIPTGWTVQYIDDTVAVETNYLTFTAEEDGSTFGIVNKDNNPDVQYSLDGGETWTALAAGDTITLVHKGDKALLRGDNSEGFSKRSNKYSSFTMTGKIAASGSVMSLIDGTGETLVVPADYCFYSLFRGCTSLTQAPELPATTLAQYCYYHMFEECTSLTRAPELPATTLTEDCYAYMFRGCTSLTRAPELPAMTMAKRCYAFMFSGCTSLTQSPALPATTLADACYCYMFSSCTSLTEAPALPATTLAQACYSGMFQECTSLTRAPELPVTTLPTVSGVKNGCYSGMFSDCTSLSQIRVSFDDWNDGLHTVIWVENVAPTGTFYCPKALPLEYGVNRIPEGWTVKYIDDTVAVETNYLTFTAEEDGSTFGIVNNGGNNPDVQYSLDGGETWTALVKGDAITLVNKGDKALLRGDNPEGFSKGSNKYSSFTMTGKIAASGSVMSLIDGTGETLVVPADYCFYSLFEDCTNLTQAPELPATTLADYCYSYMFKGCTSLTQAPELPATTLAERCYGVMFSGCTSLTQAPELPATTLADGCYHYMFKGCTSLTQAPELPATTLAERCYNGMFSSCTSLTQAPKLPATTLTDYCYVEMFSGCTSLTQAPELPATTLAGRCYAYMFEGCTSLTQAPELLATTLAERCYNGMFSSCTSLTQAHKLPATTLADYCYDEMFSGCTSLTQAPELPATTLAYDCYDGMFSGCTSLTQAPELPATTLADYCYDVMFSGCTNLSEIRVAFVEWKNSSNQDDNTHLWVKNVAQTGTFYCPKALPLEYGLDRIPEGWTVKYIEEGTGVNDAVASETTVWTEGNTIYVRGAESDIEVYDMSGRLIVSKRNGQENIQIPVPQKGIYVVKVGTETHKVELR